ncbi:MAG: DUF29 domain-containing protein [Acetobacteraceae bacterium]|nr:DUF29 domain-containing protein [Acetobacteraceae bacterium]
MQGLYERDFYAWASEQAELLRTHRLDAADIENIAEELETLGRSEKSALRNHLSNLLQHLLKWQHQPARRGASWRLSIANARDEVADILADSPSLRAQLDAVIKTAFGRARRNAALETGLDAQVFPDRCPWSSDQLMDEGFWPD